MTSLAAVNNTISFLDQVINEFETTQLNERIEVSGNKASVIIDDFSASPLLKNLKKILIASKQFLLNIFQMPKAPTTKYIKYFRLLSEDAEKTSIAAAKEITRGYWNRKWPAKVLENGKIAIDKSINDLNSMFSLVNTKINYIPEKIKIIKPVSWTRKRQRYIESSIFSDIYLENKLDEIEQAYKKGIIDSKEAEIQLRKIWGQLGYKVSPDNAQMYINLLHERLQESKQHLILKQPNLTTEQKEKAIAFFDKYKNLEKEINWNKKEIPYEEFERVYQLANSTNSAKKKDIRSGNLAKQFEGTKTKVWYYDENVIFASPTCHSDAIFMDSFECFGSGAKWCIGTKDDGKHWETYTQEYMSAFLFVYNAKSKQKFMIEILNMDDSHPLSLWNAEDDDIVVKGEVDDVIYKMGILIDYEDLIKDLIPKVIDLFVPLRSKFHDTKIDTPEKVFEILEQLKEIPDNVIYEQIIDKLGYMFQDGNKADEILNEYISKNIKNIDEPKKLVCAVALFKEHSDDYGDKTAKLCQNIITKIVKNSKLQFKNEILEIINRREDLATTFLLNDDIKSLDSSLIYLKDHHFNMLINLDRPELQDNKYKPPYTCETVYDDKRINISKTSLSNLNSVIIEYNSSINNELRYQIRAVKNAYHPSVRDYKTQDEFNEFIKNSTLWVIYLYQIHSFLLVTNEDRELVFYTENGEAGRGGPSDIAGELNYLYRTKAKLYNKLLNNSGYNIPMQFNYLYQNREFRSVFTKLEESIKSFREIYYS